jgi:soluble lytic murein transglycosylase
MLKNIFFFIKTLLIIFILIGNLYALELTIIPLKKPILDKKSTVDILKPKPKPNKETNEPKVSIEKKKKVKSKINFLIPKSKPLIVKKSTTIAKKNSKYYSKRDFDLAKKSILAIEKRQWTSALSISKKARDKSIHNFIQWRHLLTSGNQASFYDYMQFIKNNEDYPRINRIKYLAEHKLSTEKISPKKIIDWFGPNDPLSGFGK